MRTDRAVLCGISVVLLICLIAPLSVQAGGQAVRIGVLAYRGKERAIEMWSQTAQYLSSRIPQRSFSIVPLDFSEIGPAVGSGDIEFVITNTSIYVELESRYGVSRIATLQNRRGGAFYTVFGGVIFCRSDRGDIVALRDLIGRSFMAVDDTSLGGWRTAWREFRAQGIDPYRDFSSLRFGGTHDAVVYAVRDGRVDAGTVRTDTLERMVQDGAIDPTIFRVMNQQQVRDFPFLLSTRLYPEWPIAKIKTTPDDLSRDVVIALLRMRPDDRAAKAARIGGWTIPHDYQPVHELMKELQVGPYSDFGRITVAGAVREYWHWVALSVVLLLFALATAGYVLSLNRRLFRYQRKLQKAQENLELKVQERTAELNMVNEDLEHEIAERIRAERETSGLQEQLFQTQKMEAIGLLAGGVAHDFNNILTAIIGYANLALSRMDADAQTRSYLDNILASSMRAANLTQGLLAFSRKQIINPKPADLNEIVRGIERLLQRIIGEDIEFKTMLAREEMTVLADSGQIGQVLLNLATNARDAMPDGGVLTISTAFSEGQDADDGVLPAGKPGQYATITVADTGPGMDDATKEKIFEPFFTTKEVGKGTGLGLAIAFGIIKQHDGVITVDSGPGRGTTFTVRLPVIREKAQEEEKADMFFLEGGKETILVAEDDRDVRELVRTMLEEYGYRVLLAVDGADALVKFEEHRESVQLLLLDVIMPKKNGKEVYKEIRKMRPEIKALFISGYTSDIIDKAMILEDGLEFVAKPVSMHELLKKVRSILGAGIMTATLVQEPMQPGAEQGREGG